jgi:5-methyltetrahydropteroyltriglutamate--homocysteine methyltransferase
MLYSTNRILTTHAGSLPRPPDVGEMVFARANGSPYDPTKLEERLKAAVAEVVRRQAQSGIDCVNDGELS